MKVEVGLAPLEFTKIVLVLFGCVLPAKLIKVDQRKLFPALFDEKGWIMKHVRKILAKKYIVNDPFFLSLIIKSTTLLLSIFTFFFYKND